MQIFGLVYLGAKPVPLQNVKVEANVVDMIAEVIIQQTYKNVENDSIEAIYKFPIYEAAAICGFEAEIDGQRKIKGLVKEAKEAAEDYDEAIQQGHGAYLLEEQLDDVFQCTVGNIASGQTIVIKITYVTELKHNADAEQIRFILPTAIAPRYGSSHDASSNIPANIGDDVPSHLPTTSNNGKKLIPDLVFYSSSTNYHLDLNIICRMTSSIQTIESPSHHISTELNVDGDPKVSKITLAEDITYLEKDFILVVKSQDLDLPRAFVEYNSITETNCVMLTLVPKFALSETLMELIFVIDRSGSMEGEPIQKAAQTLQLLIHSLPENCYFNVVSFGSHYDSLFPQSQLYSQTTLTRALEHSRTISANYGGTEIYNPLKWVFDNARSDIPTSVFLLTDGQVWNVERLVGLIRINVEQKNDSLRLFSIGIGDSVSHDLIESVARAGKGYTQYVTISERMDKKILGMLKNAIKPPIKNYNITWVENGLECEDTCISQSQDLVVFVDVKIKQAPFTIPPIYSNVRLIVYCILAKGVSPNKEITLTAQSPDGPIKLTIPLDLVTLQGSKIHTLAARKLIRDLEDGTSFIHEHPKNKTNTIPISVIQEQVVYLGKAFNLVSKYTSFLAVDEKGDELVKTQYHHPETRIIPTQLSENKVHKVTRSIKDTNLEFSLSLRELACGGQILEELEEESTDMFCESSQYFGKPARKRQMSMSPVDYIKGFFSVFTQKKSSDDKSFNESKVNYEHSSKEVVDNELNFEYSEIQVNDELNFKKTNNGLNFKESKMEVLLEFLNFQSFDGKFSPTSQFYSCFNKEFKNLKEEIGIDNEEILCIALAIGYLEIVMFSQFKVECEMCWEKANKALSKLIGDDKVVYDVLEKARDWISKWVET